MCTVNSKSSECDIVMRCQIILEALNCCEKLSKLCFGNFVGRHPLKRLPGPNKDTPSKQLQYEQNCQDSAFIVLCHIFITAPILLTRCLFIGCMFVDGIISHDPSQLSFNFFFFFFFFLNKRFLHTSCLKSDFKLKLKLEVFSLKLKLKLRKEERGGVQANPKLNTFVH